MHLTRHPASKPARLIGVSRSATIGAALLLAVGTAGVSLHAQAAPHAPAVVTPPTVRTYPLQSHSLPHELSPKAQAKLPKISARVLELVRKQLDQDALLPVQAVSALHIRNAFRKPLGNDAWRSAVRISWRESRLLPNIVNDRNTNKTQDWGLFQLNDGGTLQYVGGTPGLSALRPRWNARAAAKIVASEGWGPWGGMM